MKPRKFSVYSSNKKYYNGLAFFKKCMCKYCRSISQKKICKSFISKLTDSDAVNSETNVWLEFALRCEYISEEQYIKLTAKNMEIGKIINYMMNHPEKFGCTINP